MAKQRKARYFVLGVYDPLTPRSPVRLFGPIVKENDEDFRRVRSALERLWKFNEGNPGRMAVGVFPIHIETGGRPFSATMADELPQNERVAS